VEHMWPLLVTKMFRPMIAVGPQGVEIAIDDQACRSRVAKVVRHMAATRRPQVGQPST